MRSGLGRFMGFTFSNVGGCQALLTRARNQQCNVGRSKVVIPKRAVDDRVSLIRTASSGSGEKNACVDVFAKSACTTGSKPTMVLSIERDCARTNMRAPNLAPSDNMDSNR